MFVGRVIILLLNHIFLDFKLLLYIINVIVLFQKKIIFVVNIPVIPMKVVENKGESECSNKQNF